MKKKRLGKDLYEDKMIPTKKKLTYNLIFNEFF